ncbi:MAG: PEGA domain-containing protein [Ignavibacteriaceae bacterium]|nr:PEGA domain-containing protein [Ignavibacteriaceae bacterium]
MKKSLTIIIGSLTILFNSCQKDVTVSPDDVIPQYGVLNVDSYPQGAKIYIDGVHTGEVTPSTIKWVDEEKHILTLKKELFSDYSFEFEVIKNDTTKLFIDYTTLKKMRGSISCDTTPRGAEIFINDSATGKITPASIDNLFPGQYTVKYKKTGYWDGSVDVVVKSVYASYAKVTLEDTLVWIKYETKRCDIPTDYILEIAVEGNIKWLGTQGKGLIKFDDVNWISYNTSNSPLPSDNVNYIEIDKYGKKWLCTDNGLAVFDNFNWTIYNSSNSGLPTNLISCITFDSIGNSWVGTFDAGVAKFDGSNWTVYNSSNSILPTNDVRSIAVDRVGIVWIGTRFGGVTKHSPSNNTWKIYNKSNTRLPGQPMNPQNGIPNDNIEALLVTDGVTPMGMLWIALGEQPGLIGGIATFRGVGYWTTWVGTPSAEVWDIAVDNSNVKWFANAWDGLSKFTGIGYPKTNGKWTHYNVTNSLIGTNRLTSVAVDSKNIKWIGSMGKGLIKYKGN